MTDMNVTPPDTVLPCGCVLRCTIVIGVNTLTVIPCRQSCVHYRTLLALADEEGIAPEFRRAP